MWLLFAALVAACAASPHTVLVILVDDLDASLTPLDTAMPKLQRLVREPGTMFTNAFVTTPVCCPSRASILTGRYQHNTGCLRNNVPGGCGGAAWKRELEPGTFATHLHALGWRTGYFGKYLNTYAEDADGVAHVPPGWSEWLGLKGNSVYYNYTLSANGRAEEHGAVYDEDYLVDVLAERSAAFLAASLAADPSASVLAVVAPPAAHSPFDPAPQYAELFPGVTAPRTPNWNTGRDGKHWLVGAHRVMQAPEVLLSDLSYRRRLLTLQSLDDLVERLVGALAAIGRLETAHIFFTSDNGFHLGQFTMPDDKRLPYEFDLRVPFIVRAPGCAARTSTTPLLNIDIAPTLLDLAGLPAPAGMDGVSFLPLLAEEAEERPTSRTFLVEYHGERSANSSDGQYKSMTTPWVTPPLFAGPPATKMQDAENNTYACLRTLAPSRDTLYCEFFQQDTSPAPYFYEFYDIARDPFQMNNTYPLLGLGDSAALHRGLEALRRCRGRHECRGVGATAVEWV